jgi:cysteinyl-tRNA synthetase
MSKSLGNFYTLRDLLKQGHSPEAIRYLLASVPYRKQLNFTMDGLRGAAASIERLRNFQFRASSTSFPEGTNEAIANRTSAFPAAFRAAMDDDLNTAAALGALFELVRDLNVAIESGEFRSGNVAPALSCLETANAIFDILPRADQRQVSHSVDAFVSLSDAEVEAKIQEREQARKGRNFARSDAIRKELVDAGVLIEDTKDGMRWRRK